MSLRASVAVVLTLSSAALAVPPDRDREPRGRAIERVVVELEHPLLESDRAEMRALGVEPIAPAGRGRLLVRADRDAVDRLQGSGLILGVERLTPERRLHTTAVRDLASRLAPGRFGVVFSPDVPLGEAVAAVASAGAWPVDPLMLEFSPPRTVWVHASRAAVDRLTRDETVLLVHGREGALDPMTIAGMADEGVVGADNEGAQALSNVEPLREAPYGLTGAGVVAGILDIGAAQASHPEFEGRVTVHSSGTPQQHPTHVTGTVAAKGSVQPRAEGMAPASMVHQFAHGSAFLQDKRDAFDNLDVKVDNNSWGFVTGWSLDDDTSTWGWYENDAFGGYSPTSSSLDNLVRTSDSMIMFSAGNDGGEAGPTTFPYRHTHANDDDDEAIWCSSDDGSGTDCPADPCGNRCELERHPSDGVFLNISRTGSAKNVIAVGAVNSQRVIASFSSRGPTRDGRVKPDLVAKGVLIYSTNINGTYATLQGTSMAAPVVTGIGALVIEQWVRTFGATPGPAALKALLIHGGQDIGNPGPDYTYGFGLVDAKASVDTILADGGAGTRIQSGSVDTGDTIEFPLELSPGAAAKATLVWIDPELIGNQQYDDVTIINDLDLEAIAPNGEKIGSWILDPANPNEPATRGRNFRDTVEQLEFTAEQGGMHRIVVRGTSVPGTQDQPFVLVSNAPLGPAQAGCADVFEPNDDANSAWGRLLPGRTLSPKICRDTDIDYFRFLVDRSGEVRVTVAAPASVAVEVTLTAAGVNLVQIVPAGQTQTIVAHVGSGTGNPIAPTNFLLRIAPQGPVPSPAPYTVSAVYNSSVMPRQRSVRR